MVKKNQQDIDWDLVQLANPHTLGKSLGFGSIPSAMQLDVPAKLLSSEQGDEVLKKLAKNPFAEVGGQRYTSPTFVYLMQNLLDAYSSDVDKSEVLRKVAAIQNHVSQTPVFRVPSGEVVTTRPEFITQLDELEELDLYDEFSSDLGSVLDEQGMGNLSKYDINFNGDKFAFRTLDGFSDFVGDFASRTWGDEGRRVRKVSKVLSKADRLFQEGKRPAWIKPVVANDPTNPFRPGKTQYGNSTKEDPTKPPVTEIMWELDSTPTMYGDEESLTMILEELTRPDYHEGPDKPDKPSLGDKFKSFMRKPANVGLAALVALAGGWATYEGVKLVQNNHKNDPNDNGGNNTSNPDNNNTGNNNTTNNNTNHTNLPPELNVSATHNNASDLWSFVAQVTDSDSSLEDASVKVEIYDHQAKLEEFWLNSQQSTSLVNILEGQLSSKHYDAGKVYQARITGFNDNNSTPEITLDIVADNDPSIIDVSVAKNGANLTESALFDLQYSDFDSPVTSLWLNLSKSGQNVYSKQLNAFGKFGNLTDLVALDANEPGEYQFNVTASDGSTAQGSLFVDDDPGVWVNVGLRYDRSSDKIFIEGNVSDPESNWFQGYSIEYHLYNSSTSENVSGIFQVKDGTLDSRFEEVVAEVNRDELTYDTQYTGFAEIKDQNGTVVSQLPLDFKLDPPPIRIHIFNNTDLNGMADSEYWNWVYNVTLHGEQTMHNWLIDLDNLSDANLKSEYLSNRNTLVDGNPYDTLTNLADLVKNEGAGNSKIGARQLKTLWENSKDYVANDVSFTATEKANWSRAHAFDTRINDLQTNDYFVLVFDENGDGLVDKNSEAFYVNINAGPAPYSQLESSTTVFTEGSDVLANYGQDGLNRYVAESLAHASENDFTPRDRENISEMFDFNTNFATDILDNMFNYSRFGTHQWYGNVLTSLYDLQMDTPGGFLEGGEKFYVDVDSQGELYIEVR